jgi:flagellin-like hook-associated protein FlgL
MSLVINHNMMAMNTARTLSNTYDRLNSSVQRLSSGLRINSAADDAAGLAIRELMRADIATMKQGIRNAADAISMIQTADGAMAVIDEKLTRMKELAEQAATGTYTTLQREIINSEYQAMAAEIDRIAASTNFNGVKLLDGSITNLHGGQGMKIHFGVGNDPGEDYYFINMGDVRATSTTGLQIGGDAKNDIWGQGAAGAKGLAGPGCCTAGYDSLDGPAGFTSGQIFSYGYNWDWMEDNDPDLLAGKYLAGRYSVNSSDSLQDLINKVNKGTQSRVGVKLDSAALAAAIKNGGTAAVCVGDEAYIFGSATVAGGTTIIPAVSGIAYRYVAEGTYDDAGFMFNNAPGYGFGLTQAQIQRLVSAGVSLSALGLVSAMVTASGDSTVNSAQARSLLLNRLNAAWTALNLSNLSGLTTTKSATTGYVISGGTLLASASASVLNGSGLTATINNGQTLVVHTGVYADANGNWTDNKRIASALGLDEVIFNIKNEDQAQYTTNLNATGFQSQHFLVSATTGGTYAMTANAATLMSAAGLFPKSTLQFSSASVAGPLTGVGATAAAASADLLAQIQAAWAAQYTNLPHQINFAVDDGAALTAPTAASIVAANPTATTGGVGANINPNGTVTVNTGIFIGVNGNFTSSQVVLDAFPGQFSELVYTITANGAGSDYAVTAAIGGTAVTFQPGEMFVGGSITANTITALQGNIETSIRQVIANQQGVNPAGRVFLNPQGSTTLTPPDATNLDTYKTSPTTTGVPVDLTVTVTMAGATTAIPTGSSLLGLNRLTTTAQDLITATADTLSQILNVAQANAALAGHTQMGRLVANPASAPAGPQGLSDVTDFTLSKEFFSGVLDKSVATGSYNDAGYVFNSATGYGLTSAQLALLNKAGLDLNALLLDKAFISASAISTASSASARANLLTKLGELWTELKLGDYSAISIASGVVTGMSALTGIGIGSNGSALPGDLLGLDGNATLKQGKTLIVHTGVYADSHGNWTNNVELATDLGLTEIVYHITNNDYTWYTTDVTSYTDASVKTSGGFMIANAEEIALTAAGVTVPSSFLTPSIGPITGSGATSAQASANLRISAYNMWNAKYPNPFANITLDIGNDGATETSLSFDYAKVALSATGAITNGVGSANTINVGQTLKVHTGVYVVSANGSTNFTWTTDAAIASSLGMVEMVYAVECVAGTPNTYQISLNGGTPATITETGLQGLATDLVNRVKTSLATITPATQGRVVRGANGSPTGPTPADLDGAKTGFVKNDFNPNNLGEMDVTITLAGNTYPVFNGSSPPPLSAIANMNSLAASLNTDVQFRLTLLHAAATNVDGLTGVGRVSVIAPSPAAGPTDETQIDNLNTVDNYKLAAGEQTVTKTGIIDKTKHVTVVASAGTPYTDASGRSNFGAWALASAINHNPNSQFWAMVQNHDSLGNSADMVYIFTKEGGNFNNLLACDVADGDIPSRDALAAIDFENTETSKMNESGTSFTLGGQNWGTFKPVQTRAGMGKEVWNLTLHGRDVGKERDLWIAAVTDGKHEVETPGLASDIINGLDRYSFVEIQNADNGPWAGAEVRTQSSAQEALDALNGAMERKDKVRADIGALQNRLENTITNLEIQMEALQASESRISDIDMATEMTEFVRNQVLAQAAVSMLSQANSLPQMALSLLNG